MSINSGDINSGGDDADGIIIIDEGFEFDIDSEVMIEVSEERGRIVGRAEFSNSKPQYLVRYKDGSGRAVEAWWSGDALVEIIVDPSGAEGTLQKDS